MTILQVSDKYQVDFINGKWVLVWTDNTDRADASTFRLGTDPEISSDSTPTQFTFTDQIGVALGTVIYSNVIIVEDINISANISISGGSAQFSINSGTYTSTPTTVDVDDTVQLKMTSHASNSTMVSTTLTIDTITDQWDVTTVNAFVTYTNAISYLGADHHWKFDGDSVDAIGAVVRTDTAMKYTGSPLTKDATNSALFDTRGAAVVLNTTTTINNFAQTRKAVAGWFMVDAKELPTCTIYSEGVTATNFLLAIFPGNSIMLQVRESTNWQVQVYSDISLEPDRVYHFCMIFEGAGYSDELRFYIDGFEQTSAYPTDRASGDTTIAIRDQAIFGNTEPTLTVGINGVNLAMFGSGDDNLDFVYNGGSTTRDAGDGQVVNAYYQHWCAWGDEADAVLTDTEVRETLFERGALADITIPTDTEANMQTGAGSGAGLDDYSTTTRSDAALCIEIEAVTGGEDFTLDVDDITFDPLASCHIRFNGMTNKLTLRNTNGSNCSIISAPYGSATIEVFTEVTVQITVRSASDLTVITGAMVLLEAGAGGDLAEGTDIIKDVTVAGVISVDFDYSSDQPVAGVIRKGTSSPYFKEGTFTGTITENGLDGIVLLVGDE